MSEQTNRREFLGTAAVAGVGFWVSGTPADEKARGPLEKIRFACIGIAGKGTSDTADAARHGEVIAICDVDATRLGKAGETYSRAQRFQDFRALFDKMGKSIDAVTVSTPDHTHAAASAMAMRLGKHCFTQKPLTRTIWEARRLGEIAREKKVATQMGNQGTASSGLRKAAALLRAGVLGTVKEVHVWTNRPIWEQGVKRPPNAEVPAHLAWNLWLGPSPERPYAVYPKGRGPYHPFGWRGWWDFGSGALGDMACHTLNMPFMGLDLRDPTEVEAESSGHDRDSFPKWSIIRYAFPARGKRPALKMVWYDGGKRPARELFGEGDIEVARSGALIIGDKGRMYAPGDNGGKARLLGVGEVKVDFPTSPGHFKEFADAIRGGKPAMSNFPDYASPLTETVLLGNLAVFTGKKVEWDSKAMKVKNLDDPAVERLIRPIYRKGWEL
jgi:predicted dehydrogenase